MNAIMPRIADEIVGRIARKYMESAVENLQVAEAGSNLEQAILFQAICDAIKEAEFHLIRVCEQYQKIARDAVNANPAVARLGEHITKGGAAGASPRKGDESNV